MRDINDLLRFYAFHCDEKLVLCTLIAKQGSAYRAIGAKKIVAQEGRSCGLLSGGCLEAEIVKKVQENWNNLPFKCSLSTMSPEDVIFGFQSGCAGIIDILFEELPPRCADIELYIPYGHTPRGAGVSVSLQNPDLGKRIFVADKGQNEPQSYFDKWQKPIDLSIIGCGLDALPYYSLCATLGWNLRFYDYRSSLRDNLPPEANVTLLPIDEIAPCLVSGSQSAVLLMTHNYITDLRVLHHLVGASVRQTFGYIGCLGPRQRFEQMRGELGVTLPEKFSSIIHAPPGLFQGTHNPESIALSIVSDIEKHLGSA